MKRFTSCVLGFLVAATLLSVVGCGNGDDGELDGADAEFSYTFERGAEGWAVAFADLPVDYDPSIYELDYDHGPLPDGLQGSGTYVQGHKGTYPSGYRRACNVIAPECPDFLTPHFHVQPCRIANPFKGIPKSGCPLNTTVWHKASGSSRSLAE